MTNMNGPLIVQAPLNEDQQACIDLLEQSLEVARRGDISSIAIIVCMKGGYSHVMAGAQAAELNLGCDSVKADILDRVKTAPKTAAVSRIVRARPV